MSRATFLKSDEYIHRDNLLRKGSIKEYLMALDFAGSNSGYQFINKSSVRPCRRWIGKMRLPTLLFHSGINANDTTAMVCGRNVEQIFA